MLFYFELTPATSFCVIWLSCLLKNPNKLIYKIFGACSFDVNNDTGAFAWLFSLKSSVIVKFLVFVFGSDVRIGTADRRRGGKYEKVHAGLYRGLRCQRTEM